MAAHASVDFTHALFPVLPVMLVATIPISIAGRGVRKSAMIIVFSYAGLAEADGLIVSILFGLATLATGTVGGIVWIASGYRWRSVKTIEAALSRTTLPMIGHRETHRATNRFTSASFIRAVL